MTAALATIGAEEQWAPVGGTTYDVSSRGRVRNEQGRVLKPRLHINGYIRVSLKQGDVIRDHYVHRLVCRAFYGAPPRHDCHADHINCDRADNRLENLRWLTPEDNRALRSFRSGEAHHASKLAVEDVRFIRRHKYLSAGKLAAQFGVSSRTVRDARTGKTWSHIQ